jgi:hypothetical protein
MADKKTEIRIRIKRPARSFIDVQADLFMLKSGSDLI